MRNDDRIINQIEGLGFRRLAGCLFRIFALMIVGGVVFGLVARHVQDGFTLAMLVIAFSGLLLGISTAPLATRQRQFLTLVLIVAPVIISLAMFVRRTLFGDADYLPFRLILIPVCFPLGFITGQFVCRKFLK